MGVVFGLNLVMGFFSWFFWFEVVKGLGVFWCKTAARMLMAIFDEFVCLDWA
jgi:hypothetical protein